MRSSSIHDLRSALARLSPPLGQGGFLDAVSSARWQVVVALLHACTLFLAPAQAAAQGLLFHKRWRMHMPQPYREHQNTFAGIGHCRRGIPRTSFVG